MEAHDLRRDAVLLKLVRCLDYLGQHVAGRQQADIAALGNGDGLANLEVGDGCGMHHRFALLAHADIDRAVLLHRRPQRGANLKGVARANHHHVRDRAQERNILAGMVCRAEARIGKAGADRDDGHGRFVIADIGADLFQTTRGHERGDGIGHRPQAVHRHAGGNAHHVGLRHAAIEEARGMLVLELVEQAVADVAR